MTTCGHWWSLNSLKGRLLSEYYWRLAEMLASHLKPSAEICPENNKTLSILLQKTLVLLLLVYGVSLEEVTWIATFSCLQALHKSWYVSVVSLPTSIKFLSFYREFQKEDIFIRWSIVWTESFHKISLILRQWGESRWQKKINKSIKTLSITF